MPASFAGSRDPRIGDAPEPGRPDWMTGLLREIGPVWHHDIRSAGDRVKAAYLPLLSAAPRDGVRVERDVAYGAHPRQVLDVYRTAGARKAPVVVFVHGGAFVRGAKDINAEMYANVPTWFARRGCVAVNVEYRLAPEAPYPHGALDIAAACAWVTQQIASFGGDPSTVCLIGHSAGGTHAASFVCDPALAQLPRRLSSLVLVSARLEADTLPHNPNAAGVRAYFGSDERLHAAAAPMAHAARLDIPVLVVSAQYENPLLEVYAAEFARRVEAAGIIAPGRVVASDHNHVSIMAHFNSGEEGLGVQILDFMEGARRRPARLD